MNRLVRDIPQRDTIGIAHPGQVPRVLEAVRPHHIILLDAGGKCHLKYRDAGNPGYAS